MVGEENDAGKTSNKERMNASEEKKESKKGKGRSIPVVPNGLQR